MLTALDRLRRIQQRHRRLGGRVSLPDPDLAGNELALRVGADPAGARFIDAGLRAMAAGIRSQNLAVPNVVGAQLSSRELEILLDAPAAPAPVGFSARHGGRRWVLARSTDVAQLEEAGADFPAPVPALVTVGQADSGARVLVNLEAGGLTCIGGDAEEARQVLYAAAAELATSCWADYLSLVLVGFGDGLARLERVRTATTVAEVIAELEGEADAIGRVLDDVECSSTLEARVKEPADTWAPTVVLCAKPPPAGVAKRLAALATTPDQRRRRRGGGRRHASCALATGGPRRAAQNRAPWPRGDGPGAVEGGVGVDRRAA